MAIRLVDANWSGELDGALRTDSSSLHVICPFIKLGVAERLLRHGARRPFRVITRFNLSDACDGVTDLGALRMLMEHGVEIRGVKGLHAKVYIFGSSRVMVTSANLTEAALTRNHEFGIVADDLEIVGQCMRYFESLWSRAGETLVESKLTGWEDRVRAQLVAAVSSGRAGGLGDEGTDIGIAPALPSMLGWAAEARRAFVKLLGEGNNRADRSLNSLDEIDRAGCHWACAWPRGRRPRQIGDGDIVFSGRLVKQPNDILVFGMAIGLRYRGTTDDASVEEIRARPWKARWPHYVRVHHSEFVAGPLANGVSLGRLMGELGANAFVSTQKNVAAGKGNVDPRLAFRQHPAVELSSTGREWMLLRLEEAFQLFGKVPDDSLRALDWPVAMPFPSG